MTTPPTISVTVPDSPQITVTIPDQVPVQASVVQHVIDVEVAGAPGPAGPTGPTGPTGPGLDQTTADARYVNIDGDTMTGSLQTQAHLIANLGQVVSSTFGNINWTPSDVTVWASWGVVLQANGVSGPTVRLAPDGSVTVSVDPTAPMNVATKQYVDARAPKIVASTTAPTDLTAIWIDTN